MFAAAALTGCKNDDPSDTSFSNKLYIETDSKVSTLMVKPSTLSASNVIRSSVAKPATAPIDIVYQAAPDKVTLYNAAYYDQAVMLPEQNYELVETKAVIPVGGVKSTDIHLNLKELNTLDRKVVYVLPVTIASASNIELLEGSRTVYYVLKAGAVINVVANIRINYLSIAWTTPAAVNNLTKITMEALVRVHSFDHIMSIMGIEETLLIRISDEGYESDALQIATTPNNNFPDTNHAPTIPKGVWTQISVTYNTTTGAYVIYLDGKPKASGIGPKIGAVNLASKDFFIGRSYNNDRWLDGEISECRIWNVIRTQEQIANSRYEVDPTSEGLVSYWKFDEGSGNMVSDRTVNGNHATAASRLMWIDVTLPE